MSEHQMIHITPEQLAGAHSIYAPSAAAMWIVCSGSLLANLNAPDSAGFEAAEGTVAHAMGEQWLKTGVRPTSRVGDIEWIEEAGDFFLIPITEEMLEFVEEYVVWCEELPGVHYVEQRVYFSELTPLPKQGGTADHFAIIGRVLIITDLKYGLGVKVFAKNNWQAMLYALGVIFKYDFIHRFEKVVIRICQPRMNHFDEWETTVEELFMFAGYVRLRAAAAWVPNAPRTPSAKGCMWCRVKKTCGAHLAWIDNLNATLADDSFEDVTFTEEQMRDAADTLSSDMLSPALVPPFELNTKQLAKLLPFRPLIEGWFKSIDDELNRRAYSGERVPDMKLVEGRSNRVFKNKALAESTLIKAGVESSSLYKSAFIGPTDAEAELRKAGHNRKSALEILAKVVIKPPGKPTLVSASDKRPELVDVADDSFDDESEL